MGGRLGGEEALPFTALWTPGATGRARRRLQTSVGGLLSPPPRGLEEGVEGSGFPGGRPHQGE